MGKISGADGKAGIPGATVIAYHLSTEELFYSPATNAKGEYQLENLPAGYYDVAVRTPQGLFIGTSVLNVAPARKAIANFSVMPFGSEPTGDAPGERAFPGSEGTTAGSAEVEKKLTTREFWSSAKGVAILASGGTAILLAIVSNDDEQIVSGF